MQVATELRAAVAQETGGLTCSVGVAPNQMLAKVRPAKRARAAQDAPHAARGALGVKGTSGALYPAGGVCCPCTASREAPRSWSYPRRSLLAGQAGDAAAAAMACLAPRSPWPQPANAPNCKPAPP